MKDFEDFGGSAPLRAAKIVNSTALSRFTTIQYDGVFSSVPCTLHLALPSRSSRSPVSALAGWCFGTCHASLENLGEARSLLIASFLSQTLLIFVAMVVVHCGRINGNLDTIIADFDWDTVIPIALLSFRSVGQTVGSRALNLFGIPTVVLTSILHNIFADRKLVAKDSVKRDPRILVLFAIVIGAASHADTVADGRDPEVDFHAGWGILAREANIFGLSM